MKDSMHLQSWGKESGGWQTETHCSAFLGPEMDVATHCIKAALKELVPSEDEDATTQH